MTGGRRPAPQHAGAERARRTCRRHRAALAADRRDRDRLPLHRRPGVHHRRGVRLYETPSGRDLADFGLVQVLGYTPPTGTLLSAIAEYLHARDVPTVNVADVGAPTRLLQYVRLAQAGLPVPATRYLPPARLASCYPAASAGLGVPFVLKSLGLGSSANHLISTAADLARHAGSRTHQRGRLLVQEFVPNLSTLHLLVLAGQVHLAVRRPSGEAVYLADPRAGGAATRVDPEAFDPAVTTLATGAAAIMGWDIAGVTLIRHWTTDQWYVLGLNPYPVIGGGAFATDKLTAYKSYLQAKLPRPRSAAA